MGVATAFVALVAAVVTAVVTAAGTVVTALVAVVSTIWVVSTAAVTAAVKELVEVRALSVYPTCHAFRWFHPLTTLKLV